MKVQKVFHRNLQSLLLCENYFDANYLSFAIFFNTQNEIKVAVDMESDISLIMNNYDNTIIS